MFRLVHTVLRLDPQPSSYMLIQVFTYTLAHRDIQHLSGNLSVLMLLGLDIQQSGFMGEAKFFHWSVLASVVGGVVGTFQSGGLQGSSGLVLMYALLHYLYAGKIARCSRQTRNAILSKEKDQREPHVLALKKNMALLIILLYSTRVFFEYEYDEKNYNWYINYMANVASYHGDALAPGHPSYPDFPHWSERRDSNVVTSPTSTNQVNDEDNEKWDMEEFTLTSSGLDALNDPGELRPVERRLLQFNEYNSWLAHLATAVFGAFIYPSIFSPFQDPKPVGFLTWLWKKLTGKKEQEEEEGEESGFFTRFRPGFLRRDSDEDSEEDSVHSDDNRGILSRLGFFTKDRKDKKPRKKRTKRKKANQRKRNSVSSDIYANIPKEKRRGPRYRGTPNKLANRRYSSSE